MFSIEMMLRDDEQDRGEDYKSMVTRVNEIWIVRWAMKD